MAKKKVTRRRRRPTTKRRSGGKSFIRSAEKILGIANFVGPEVGTVWANPSPEGLGEALSLKSGVDPIGKTVDFSRLIYGWGGYAMFNLVSKGIHKLNGLISKL